MALWAGGALIPPAFAQNKAAALGHGAVSTSDEKRLYALLMDYRRSKGLPPVLLSPSLNLVAKTHVRDLMINRPVTGQCNMHSWSAKGKWSSCCYTEDHAQAQCMWSKPEELTHYRGSGFEIAHGMMPREGSTGKTSFRATPDGALQGWKGSKGHNEVIINAGGWSKMKWQAVGVGMQGGYAVVWFGADKDPASQP